MSQRAKQRYKKTGINITQASGETKVSKTTCVEQSLGQEIVGDKGSWNSELMQ